MPEAIGEGFVNRLTCMQGLETNNLSVFFYMPIEVGGKICIVMLQWKTQESLRALRRFVSLRLGVKSLGTYTF